MPLFDSCQRWKQGRASYRPAGELFDPGRFAVEPITFGDARQFVCAHHYSGSMPVARLQVGLIHKPTRFVASTLVGVVVFSVPVQERAVPAWLDGLDPRLGVELGRLVLSDRVQANGETWFLGRAFKQLRRDLPEVRGVISYCDPLERCNAEGQVVKRGHVGTVYKAFNGLYRGHSSPRTLTVARDGRCVNERALSKIRLEEQGAAYAIRQLEELGASRRFPGEAGAAYVARVMREGDFKKLRHPGNHVFTWRVSRL